MFAGFMAGIVFGGIAVGVTRNAGLGTLVFLGCIAWGLYEQFRSHGKKP